MERKNENQHADMARAEVFKLFLDNCFCSKARHKSLFTRVLAVVCREEFCCEPAVDVITHCKLADDVREVSVRWTGVGF